MGEKENKILIPVYFVVGHVNGERLEVPLIRRQEGEPNNYETEIDTFTESNIIDPSELFND